MSKLKRKEKIKNKLRQLTFRDDDEAVLPRAKSLNDWRKKEISQLRI